MTYKRVLLKISGEVLMGSQPYGIDMDFTKSIAAQIKQVREMGIELCLVIGGGNIFRGISGAAQGMNRANGDYMGMLATVMNALAMQNALEQVGVEARVLSAIPMPTVCEPFIRARAESHLKKKHVVIFAAGTGNPFFTTDTGAALRAAEMNCDALLKGTSVDGVYDADPKSEPSAKRYEQLSYTDILSKDLRIMDAAAVALARDNNIPIIVFSIREENNIVNLLQERAEHTVVGN